MTEEIYLLDHNLKGIDPMVQKLTDKAGRYLPTDGRSRFRISATEALTNLVLHARNCTPDAVIKVILQVNEPQVDLEIYDPEGADPFDVPKNATHLDTIDAMAEGGRGLGLIMACSDAVKYGATNAGNRLKLSFNRHG